MLLSAGSMNGQICDPITPVYYVDLTGQPSGVWVSPNTPRAGLCCGATAPDICIQFVITLDSSANGIKFDILAGAAPPGALFYQVGCGTPVQVGQPLCLNGPGPHYLTFCKPGNNSNVYGITSLPQPSTYGSEWVSQACSGTLGVGGLVETSITWTSIPPNPLYNSFLSCTANCEQVTVTPSGTNFPPYVDYQVCGYVVGGCFPYFYCDTLRVNFVNNLAVDITPQNHVICFGMPNIPITANTTGGLAPYQFLWSTGETTQTIVVGPGTYSVQLQDSMSCSIAYDTVIVYGVPSAIVADAGPDAVMCTNQQNIMLNGNVLTATGGVWSGGAGNFTPNATTLNAVYTPTASEIMSGSVQLFLTTTGNQGCPPETDTVNITISPSPSPSISGISNVCEFDVTTYLTPQNLGNSYNWNVSGGTIISSNQNTITVEWGNTGNGVIYVTETNPLLCDSTVIYLVIINATPQPLINGPLIVCTTSITQYTLGNINPGSTYAWTVTGGIINGSANGSSLYVSWSVSGNATIIVTETNSSGCDSTVQIPVTVLTIPTPSISGLVNGCAGQNITYTTSLVPGNTYNWNVTGGTIVSNNNNSIIVNWPTATNGIVTLNEVNALACDSAVSLNVVVGPQPMPVITGVDTVCTGTTVMYQNQNPVAGDNYLWNVVGGTIVGVSTNSTVNILWTTSGQGMVSLIHSNSYGCDSLVSIPITILTMPEPVLSGPVNTCSGYMATYTTPLVSGNTYNWNVTGGNIISNNGNTITIQWPLSGVGTVTLTEANTFACDSTVSLNVSIGEQPVPNISGPLMLCTNETVTYRLTTPVIGNNYIWSVTGGTISGPNNGTSINVIFSTPGIQTVNLTESNSSGCDSTLVIQVNVRLKPEPVLSGLPVNCADSRSIYSVQNFPAHSYSWMVNGGSIIGNNVGNSIDVLWVTPGTGSVAVRVVSPLGCDSLVSMNVVVNPLPATSLSGPVEMCENEGANYFTMFSGNNTYAWTVTNAIITGSTTSNMTSLWFNNIGNVILTLTETTPEGCSTQLDLQINVNEKPLVAVTGNGIGCVSNQQYTYSSISQTGVNYLWNITGGTILSGNGTPVISVQWTNAGTQQIALTATNQLTGCDSTYSVSVVTGSLPTPVVNAGSLEGCVPVNLNFTGNTNSSNYNYSWDFGDGQSGYGPNPSHQYNSPGVYNIQLIATNNTGCADTIYATVTVYPNPVSAFDMWYGADIYYASLSTLLLNNTSSGATQYLWSFGNGDTSHQFTPNYQYELPGNYAVSLLVTNEHGCTDISTKYISVKLPELIYVPNAFTPNNDMVNDFFSVSGMNITSLSIMIFNRWGQSIYQSTNPSFKWDGTHNGKEAPEGVYVYKIAAKGIHGEFYDLNGTVSLMR